MRRATRLALLVILALFALPLTVSADPPAAATPDDAQQEAQSEISTEELESLLGISAPEEMACGLSDNCQGCHAQPFLCTCLCDIESIECSQACDGDFLCRYLCIQQGKACHDGCHGMES